jgi:hypothetical protein
MTKHAYLSASASHRWLACPPSAKLCAELEDQTSPYAEQGTNAHELCQYLVEKALGRDVLDPTENLSWYDPEMQDAAEGYCSYVMEQISSIQEKCSDPLICIEQKLDYSKWVKNGFGTGDCVIVADGVLHIIDFKYGVGVLVSAKGEDNTGNSQLKCYALGALDTFGTLYDINKVRLTIYQPRRSHVDTFEMSVDELTKWANEVLKPTAELAYEGKGEFKAGEHCQFCKIKATCRARAQYSMELAKYDFIEPSTLDNTEIAAILPQVDSLVSWADDIKNYALEQALAGVNYPHFKLVEGRSIRKYTDENEVAKVVLDAGYDPFEKKLLGITSMTKQLGKKKFEELLSGLVIKPTGKPVLVSDTDPRPEFNTAKSDFNEKEI